MGYADGYYYGQGRIRVDTSMFSVGDTIRVRSMTDSSIYQDKAVVTVGTPLIFTVPPYDTYKVCQIQEINNVVTEIGGVEVNIGFGDFVNTTPLDTNSLAYVQSVLNAHNENLVLNIGDEFIIKYNDGGTPTDWVMQIGDIDGTNHKIKMVSKYVYKKGKFYNSAVNYGNYAESNVAKPAIDAFYNSIDEKDKQYIKSVTRESFKYSGYVSYSAYCWLPSQKEVFNVTAGTPTIPQTQMAIFTTQANRIKTNTSGVGAYWWTTDCMSSDMGHIRVVSTAGGSNEYSTNDSTISYLPCFEMSADS